MSAMKIKYWGVRGSLPSAPMPQDWGPHFQRQLMQALHESGGDPNKAMQLLQSRPVQIMGGYGTATTCVEIQTTSSQLIIDGGSGIRSLSEDLLSPVRPQRRKFHIYMTHFHWDHVIGLPFFAMHFMKGMEVHYYAVQENLEELIRGVFKRPYFPIAFEELRAKIFFHKLEPRKKFTVEDFSLTPYMLDHPDPCWGLRVETGGKAYAHCVDSEVIRQTAEELGQDLPLYTNADLMYFDAQYTVPELAEKQNWGHSASQIGIDLALQENIKHVLFAHHDPGAGLESMVDLKKQTADYVQKKMQQSGIQSLVWDFAHEGLEINL